MNQRGWCKKGCIVNGIPCWGIHRYKTRTWCCMMRKNR